jgi:hypothetical protein
MVRIQRFTVGEAFKDADFAAAALADADLRDDSERAGPALVAAVINSRAAINFGSKAAGKRRDSESTTQPV